MRKKIIITSASLAGVALILFLFFFLDLDGKIAFFTNKSDYFNEDDFSVSEKEIEDSVLLRVDMENYSGEKTTFFEKEGCTLSIDKIEYVQNDDCYKVFVLSQGKTSSEKAKYLSLDDFNQITSTYFSGTVKMSYVSTTSLGTDGKITYEFSITHDEQVLPMDFQNLVCPFFFKNVKLVELNKK